MRPCWNNPKPGVLAVARRAATSLAAVTALAACTEPSSPTPTNPSPPGPGGSVGLDGGTPADGQVVADATGVSEPSDAGQSQDSSAPGALPAHEVRASVLDHAAWTRMEPARDPFGDAPENVYCVETATVAEDLGGEQVYDVDTTDCNYVTVHQQSRDYVAVGERIQVVLAHFDLSAPSGSEAHLVVRLGALTLLDERVPIPSPSAVLRRELVASQEIPAGADLYFHVHNHGENSYALVSVTTGP